jgi:hypothetical protein
MFQSNNGNCMVCQQRVGTRGGGGDLAWWQERRALETGRRDFSGGGARARGQWKLNRDQV